MAVGLFLLFTQLGTLDIQELMQRAAAQWPVGSALPVAAAALLLGGAVGKSAQLPLQTWLPDAMAGPTPVSALIHAATMVTAGRLPDRPHARALRAGARRCRLAVAVIGAATLLLAGFSALAQRDIKRVLAYSTISQIGYMFLALGVGAWAAAIFHFMTHAFFKALLFLAAGRGDRGAAPRARHVQDGRAAPASCRSPSGRSWSGGASLAALPLVTAGFYSKDLILWAHVASPRRQPLRCGRPAWPACCSPRSTPSAWSSWSSSGRRRRTPVSSGPASAEQIPLVVLGRAGASLAASWARGSSRFMAGALPALARDRATARRRDVARGSPPRWPSPSGCSSPGCSTCAVATVVAGDGNRGLARALHRLLAGRLGLRLALRPPLRAARRVAGARRTKADVVDAVYSGMARAGRSWPWARSARTETGRVRWYAAGIAGGAVVLAGDRAALMILVWFIAILLGRRRAGVAGRALERHRRALDRARRHAARFRARPRRCGSRRAPATSAAAPDGSSRWTGPGSRSSASASTSPWTASACCWSCSPSSSASSPCWRRGREIREGVGFFHFNLLWVLAGIAGVFLALDLFLFYFFWELMLVPMYFLIAIWGHERRVYAAVKFFLFTQLSGLLMLLAILGLYFVPSRADRRLHLRLRATCSAPPSAPARRCG